jgi:hypothetical protein
VVGGGGGPPGRGYRRPSPGGGVEAKRAARCAAAEQEHGAVGEQGRVARGAGSDATGDWRTKFLHCFTLSYAFPGSLAKVAIHTP